MENLNIKMLAQMRLLTNSIKELNRSVNNLTLEQYPVSKIPNINESQLPMHLRKQM